MENQNSQKAEPEIEVVFDYSEEDEKERVGWTLKKNKWYKENGYNPRYPKLIQQKLERNENITEDEISKAISAEFDPSIYEEKIATLKKDWAEMQEKFFENLKTIGLPLQEKYFVNITRYGTGGSYGVPNDVQLNIGGINFSCFTLGHEIVHLTIEHLIKKYEIDHWTKERLVNLIMNKFFPENQRLQKDPKNAEQISEIFESNFPDITKTIKTIS